MKTKYIVVYLTGIWWYPEKCLERISELENENPDYEFLQIVTSPETGGLQNLLL